MAAIVPSDDSIVKLGLRLDDCLDKHKDRYGRLSALPKDLHHLILKFQYSRPCQACPDCGIVLIHSCRNCMVEDAGQEFGPRCASCSRENFWECMRIRWQVKREIAELETMVQALKGSRWEF